MTFALSVSLGIMACGGSSFGGAVITATDNVGNVETIPSKGGVSIFYDVVSPTAILTPLATYQTQAPFTVEWSGSDTGSGIAGYDVEYWDGSIWQVWHTSTPLTSSGFTGNDGITYTFQVRARDNAGNVSVWSTGITTTIDAIAPESQVSAPANSQTADFEVTWSGSDATSGIVSYDVQYKDGDGAWTGWQTDTSAISATFSGQMRHSYHFQSRARDLAGHVEAWPIQP
ncbi:MAG: hypothetical protein GY833_06200, partial [Aestuariibacter sp.]|nr:hypothetical protein [Aestuariibacter sp.]